MTRALESVAELVRRESGMTIGADRMPALAAAVARVAPGLDPATLASGTPEPGLVERLLDEITVNETFFFRNVADLEAIDWPGLLVAAAAAGRREVRVWSAGCATGEEAYTLAIMACEAFGTARPPVSVLATDLSVKALERARSGVYRGRSVRSVPDPLRSRWLRPGGEAHAVEPALRELVHFERHNLVLDPVPAGGPYDLVVCRNVLIYFPPATAARVRVALEASLADGGTLLLGAADRLCAWPDPIDAPVPRVAHDPIDAPVPPLTHDAARHGLRTPARWRGGVRCPPARLESRLGPPAPPARSPENLTAALAAADAGRLVEAIEATDVALGFDPMDVSAHFVRGVAELARGDAEAAAAALRKALYLDPAHGLAAFELGRAHDMLGRNDAARRAYRQALKILDSHPATSAVERSGVDSANVRGACLARLEVLGPALRRPRAGGSGR